MKKIIKLLEEKEKDSILDNEIQFPEEILLCWIHWRKKVMLENNIFSDLINLSDEIWTWWEGLSSNMERLNCKWESTTV